MIKRNKKSSNKVPATKRRKHRTTRANSVGGMRVRRTGKRRVQKKADQISYNREYNAGFDEGYNEGFNAGYTKGLEEGAFPDPKEGEA